MPEEYSCNIKDCLYTDNTDIYKKYREQKNKCAWRLDGCKKNINMTEDQYLAKGNICVECNTRIVKIHMENIQKQKDIRRQTLEALGQQLDKDLTEEETKEIVDEMQNIYYELKSEEIHEEENYTPNEEV